MTLRTVFQLKVKKVGHICDFELSWGKGQTIVAELDYPDSLITLYQKWQDAYLGYYRHLRGRVKKSGTVPEPRKDWRTLLVEAEARLLDKFHYWLRSPELHEIRAKIASAAREHSEQEKYWVDVFLTCTPLDLARLPWETWEIGTDLGAAGKICLARKPANIRNEPVHPIRRKARILVILGDDTGLNLEGDKKALESFSGMASVEFVGGKSGKDEAELRKEICQKLEDEQGWDILFFAGHSNETELTGGELHLAPNVSLTISDIKEPLLEAQKRGLQFAIFNSCSGINIAESLIDLGLNQVVIMREPIHNRVAQEFLKQFLESLAEYKDVHEALLDAYQFLKQQENHLDYPSAYLVPSLFRHPEAELFRIEPFGFWQRLKRWLPTKREAAWLVVFLILSLVPYMQDLLLEPRIFVQAIYRQLTKQIPSPEKPPVLLVQIDEDSLDKENLPWRTREEMDRRYIAKIINRIFALESQPKVLAIDYKLWEPKPDEDEELRKSIRVGVKQGTWFVFAASLNEKKGVIPEIANLNWSLQGDINFFPWYVELLPAHADCSDTCPFAYLLTLAQALNRELDPSLPQPKLASTESQTFSHQVIENLNQVKGKSDIIAYLKNLRLHPLSHFSQNFLQQWLHPIIDFSIPPDQAYESIPAWCLLEPDSTCQVLEHRQLQQQIVMIAPGGYEGADDNFTIPLTVNLWREWSGGFFTGGEAHAYMIHHLLTQGLVVPIPDFWMILLAAFLGKGITLILLENPRKKKQWVMGLGGATAIYLLVGLQVYISVAVLIPLLLPSAIFWNYVRLSLRRKSHG